jgi:hypothetical protein
VTLVPVAHRKVTVGTGVTGATHLLAVSQITENAWRQNVDLTRDLALTVHAARHKGSVDLEMHIVVIWEDVNQDMDNAAKVNPVNLLLCISIHTFSKSESLAHP